MAEEGRPARRYPFVPRRRNYAAEERQQERRCPALPVAEEECPLGAVVSSTPEGSPLRALRRFDPRASGRQRDAASVRIRMSTREAHLTKRLNWKEQKAEILLRYTTAKNIPVQSKIVEDDVGGEPKRVTETDKARHRLEQLEKDESGKGEHLSFYTQKELIHHIESFATDLEQAWGQGEKVKSLRIVIQSCKMLCTVRCPPMYPSLFVLVAKVLDSFGSLVFDRIYQRAVETAQVRRLPPDFNGNDISPEAKEMCRNWFFKVASIRELIPRVLVEMALWRCNRYVVNDVKFFSATLARFARQCRGVGDPLIAHHMRFYLARKGVELMEDFGDELSPEFSQVCIEDVYVCNNVQLRDDRFSKFLESNQISLSDYQGLFSPTVRWLLETHTERYTAVEDLQRNLSVYAEHCRWAMVLEHIIASFPAANVTALLPEILDHIRAADINMCPRYRLWAALGRTLCDAPPPLKQDRIAVLNEAWECASARDTPDEGLLACAVAWTEFAVANLGRREVAVLLSTVRERLGSSCADNQSSLQDVLDAVASQWGDSGTVFALDDFLPLLDLLRPERRAVVGRGLLRAFATGSRPSGDPVVIGGLLDVGRFLHDRITALSDAGEVEWVSDAIAAVMGKVDHGGDHDGQLQFLVDCRGSFPRLNAVMEACVWGALRLLRRAVDAHGGVVKSHTKKLGAFVKAVLTYCHVTIPALRNPQQRSQLFIVTGSMAYTFGFLPQGEALLNAAVTALEDIPQPPRAETKGGANAVADEIESWVLRLVPSLLGVALVAPGSAKDGGLWLFEAVIKFATEREWEPSSAACGKILMSCLSCLAAMAQDRLPYHFPSPFGAPSNDDLFAGEESFVADVADLASELVEKITAEIQRLQKHMGLASTAPTMHSAIKRRTCNLALDLFEITALHSEMTSALAPLMEWLWQVSVSNLQAGDAAEELTARAAAALKYCQESCDVAVRAATEQLRLPS